MKSQNFDSKECSKGFVSIFQMLGVNADQSKEVLGETCKVLGNAAFGLCCWTAQSIQT